MLTSRKLQITIQGLRVYYCMQPHLQRPLVLWHPEMSSVSTSALLNCEDLGVFYATEELLATF